MMKTKLSLITLLFLANFYGVTQNYDIENIRAVLRAPYNNSAYFFVGKDKVYKYNIGPKKREYIKTLGAKAFKGIRGSSQIDAALVPTHFKTKAYLFRGNKWYRYNLKEGKLGREGILGQDGFSGITGPINAVVNHGTSGNYAFFKGSKVYIYSPKAGKVTYSGNIGANNVYKGVPYNIDAAIQWTNGMVYFFKRDYYYRYNPSKLRVDAPKRVIGRVGFKGLFPSIDAALGYDIKAFKGQYYAEREYNGSPPTPTASLSVLNSSRYKQTPFGYNHYEGVAHNVDAALKHYTSHVAYFLKDGTYYSYNSKERKVKTGSIKTGWNGLPSNIDAAFSSDDGYHYFFKGEKWYAYDYHRKKLKNPSGSSIRTGFRGVPDFLDAATFGINKIYFYKKNTEYVYDRGKRKIVAWKSISNLAE